MSTSFIPPVPLSIFTGILFFCNTKVKIIPLRRYRLHTQNISLHLHRNTYRPGLQDLVHRKEHQGDQSTEEDVQKHSADQTKCIL